jgi:hypothetical protein
MKLHNPYRYLYKDIDRQNHIRWRLRAPGRPTATIKGEFGSPEFAANYRTAMEGGTAIPTTIGKHGTFDALGRDISGQLHFQSLHPRASVGRW